MLEELGNCNVFSHIDKVAGFKYYSLYIPLYSVTDQQKIHQADQLITSQHTYN